MCCHKWITIIYGRVQIDFGSEQPQPQPTLSLPAPRQSNNSTQYGALRRRATATLAALKTVKPYYGNRYQISLSNRFCHPMKNCWHRRQSCVVPVLWIHYWVGFVRWQWWPTDEPHHTMERNVKWSRLPVGQWQCEPNVTLLKCPHHSSMQGAKIFGPFIFEGCGRGVARKSI